MKQQLSWGGENPRVAADRRISGVERGCCNRPKGHGNLMSWSTRWAYAVWLVMRPLFSTWSPSVHGLRSHYPELRYRCHPSCLTSLYSINSLVSSDSPLPLKSKLLMALFSFSVLKNMSPNNLSKYLRGFLMPSILQAYFAISFPFPMCSSPPKYITPAVGYYSPCTLEFSTFPTHPDTVTTGQMHLRPTNIISRKPSLSISHFLNTKAFIWLPYLHHSASHDKFSLGVCSEWMHLFSGIYYFKL